MAGSWFVSTPATKGWSVRASMPLSLRGELLLSNSSCFHGHRGRFPRRLSLCAIFIKTGPAQSYECHGPPTTRPVLRICVRPHVVLDASVSTCCLLPADGPSYMYPRCVSSTCWRTTRARTNMRTSDVLWHQGRSEAGAEAGAGAFSL